MRDGKEITERLNGMLGERGGRSAAVESLSQIFRDDRLGGPRIIAHADRWGSSRLQPW